MDEDFKKNELIAVQSGKELRFSHYENVSGERVAFGYVTDTSQEPPKKYEPLPMLSILVRGYWENPKVTE
jgi:hypothetical protein